MGLWDLKFLNQVCHQVGFMNVCSLLAWPSFTAEPAGCSVVHSEQAVCPVIFPLWQKVVPPLPPLTCTYLLQTSFPLCFCLICTMMLVCFLIWQITMRALGCEVRKAEMKRIISEVDQNGSGKINFESFLRVMTQKMVCEPSWSQRLKFLLPNFTVQVLAVDRVTGSL